jgi:hypothetical protein
VLADAEPFDADALKSFLDDSARRFQTETKSAFKYQLTQLGGSADTLDARDRLLAAYVASEQEVKDTLQTVVVEIQAHPATNPGKGGAFAQAVAGSEEQSLDALLSDAQAGKVDAAGQILKAYAKGDAVKRKALLGQAIAAAARYPSAPRDKSLAVLLEQLDEDSLDLANGGPMDLTAGVGPIIRVKGGALELALKDRLGKFDAKGTLMLLKLVPSKEVEESALDHFMGEALKALKGDAKLYTAFKKAGAELFEDDRIFDYLLEKAVLSPEPGSRLKALLDAKKFENTRTKGVVPQGLVNKMHKLLEEASISRAGECPGYEYELIKAAHKRYNKTPECDLVKILSNIANCSKGVKTNFSCP